MKAMLSYVTEKSHKVSLSKLQLALEKDSRMGHVVVLDSMSLSPKDCSDSIYFKVTIKETNDFLSMM